MLRPPILPLRDLQMQPIEHTETYSSAEMQTLAQYPRLSSLQNLSVGNPASTLA
ncbi:hypothetical protein [Herpetosiphon gulosus]|uniref:Uncharacterized protein n=1 Tax=Herpetosiphon gulosus TaxID=1973496 RepID=A0ABP9X6C0_9CHLR